MKYIQYLSKNRLVIFIVILVTFFSCVPNQQVLEVKKSVSKHPVIIYLNPKQNKATRIKFPIKIVVKNNNYRTVKFITEYIHKSANLGVGHLLYEVNKDKLSKSLNTSKWQELSANKKKEYVLYTRHYLDTTSISVQKKIKDYIAGKHIDIQNGVPVCIISDFKRNYIDLLNILTERDEILFHLNKESSFRISAKLK